MYIVIGQKSGRWPFRLQKNYRHFFAPLKTKNGKTDLHLANKLPLCKRRELTAVTIVMSLFKPFQEFGGFRLESHP